MNCAIINQKRAEIPILMSDKIFIKATVTRDKKWHFIMMKGYNYQE
jgi:hypothetical protein